MDAIVRKLLLFSLIFCSTIQNSSHHSNRVKRATTENHPRIVTQNGHLLFMTGQNHNITFKAAQGGYVNIAGIDVQSIVKKTQDNKGKIEQYKNDLTNLGTDVRAEVARDYQKKEEFETQLNSVTQLIEGLKNRLSELENRPPSTAASGPGPDIGELRDEVLALENAPAPTQRPTNNRAVRRLRNAITVLTNKVNTLYGKLDQNDCITSSPCRNGGRCTNVYNGYVCQCQPGWEGDRCEADINECAIFAGMRGHGCQNGGTCLNTPGSYTCECAANWYGIHCASQHDDCSSASDMELCGHGTCINVKRSDAGSAKFRCHCDEGWTKEGTNPACTTDIDECADNHPSCSKDPDVQCINLPGTYHCGPCPNGFVGNGWTCADINECDTNNGGCSISPKVLCLNSRGSYRCAACPPGYRGDGKTCVYVGTCGQENGGCHQLASCTETPGIGGRTCSCPSGYQGNGIGERGCVQILRPTAGPCARGFCLNGATCATFDGGPICTCAPGYSGDRCETNTNECTSNPCQNGGQCTDRVNGFSCQCTAGYTGERCQTARENCGGVLGPQPGTLSFPQESGNYGANVNCQWTILMLPGQRVILTFTNFDLESDSDCDYDYLKIYDGTSVPSMTLIGSYCGTSLPEGGTVNARQNRVLLKFHSDNSVHKRGFTLSWDADTSESDSCSLPGKGHRGLYLRNGHPSTKSGCRTDCLNEPRCSGSTFDARGRCWLHTAIMADRIYERNGFTLFRKDCVGCGGLLEGSDTGTITSPGHPANYPHNEDCTWTVKVPAGKRILFTFSVLELESHRNCSYDYLRIVDGLRDSDSTIGRYCNSTTPDPLRTSGPYALVEFHSDGSSSDRGFSITYTSEDVRVDGSSCGGELTATSGSITSPNFPQSYANDANCIWTITVPEGDRLALTFEQLAIEHDTDRCRYDSVQVRAGSDENAGLVGTYCGTTLPAERTLETNKAWVRFKSDGSRTFSGFKLNWKVACGGVFSASEGIIKSPNYPADYSNNTDCFYIIAGPDTDSQVTVTFDTFETEGGNGCQHDYLEIRDGRTDKAEILEKFCGDEVPAPLSSSGGALWMKFHTDRNIQKKGFQLNFKRSEPSCGAVLTDPIGHIQSPGYPDSYPHGADCQWTITVDPGMVIRLTFQTFSMETSSSCKYDHVAVYDNSTFTDTGGLLGRFCGSNLPPSLTSAENTMTLVLRTDASMAHEGFVVSYVALNATTLCGGQLQQDTGFIESPNFPENYPHQRECIWVIVASQGRQILLNITDFELESHVKCKYDFLQIRNGGYPSSPMIGQYCGTQIDRSIISHSNRLWIKFRADYSNSAKGFRIYFDGTSSGCGADLTTPSGSFVSPNYPLRYVHQAECFWTITVSRGSAVLLVFADFDLEHHSECKYDYLEIRDKDSTGRLLGKICGSDNPQPIKSISNRLWVKFRTDYSSHGRGFHAIYNTDCNVRLKEGYGVIESPNFPESYPGTRDCTWIVETTRGNKINASFSHFNLEAQRGCANDFLQLRDGAYANSNEIGRYCGHEFPPKLSTTGKFLFVHFESDNSFSGDGFRLEYATDGCGADFMGNSGEFTTPNYPNPYTRYKECVWRVAVGSGQRIQLNILDIDLEAAIECRDDFLEIFGGPDDSAPSLAKLCHTQDTLQQITSTGNHMFIRFVSDHVTHGRGVKANFTAIPGGCGGNTSTHSGSVVSQNYPEPYEAHTDCTWTIAVDPDSNIEMEIEDLDVEGSDDCEYDYVAFFDGIGPNAPLLTKECGRMENVTATNITTSGNRMYVRMRSDGSVTGRGFKANYVTGCGGTRMADKNGALVSPNYPAMYQPSKNCTWVLQAPAASDRVTLTFTYLDTPQMTSGDCTEDDHITIHDGNDEYAPVSNIVCGHKIPASITSHGNALTVVFRSDKDSKRGHGFRAVYSTGSQTCGGTLTSQSGVFMSPGYPETYPVNTECVWTIKAPPGNSVQFAAIGLGMPAPSDLGNCVRDYLEFRDGGETSNLRSRYCGSTTPANLTFTSNEVWLRFRSSALPSGSGLSGFSLEYSLVYGGEVTGDEGRIATPNYPMTYPRSTTAFWLVTTELGSFVQAEFEMMDLEHHPTCRFDYVMLRDGPDENSPLLGKYCGFELPAHIRTSGNLLYVAFSSDRSHEGRGFLLHWRATAEAGALSSTPMPYLNTSLCGGDLVISETPQNLTSPNYPSEYPRRTTCIWELSSLNGDKIVFNITDMRLESHSRCNFDSVQVLDGVDPGSEQLGIFCGSKPADSVNHTAISTYGDMKVVFKSDGSEQFNGFSASVYTVCGGKRGGTDGLLKSPSFPAAYGGQHNCSWLIAVRAGMTIKLQISDFDLPPKSGNGCQNDYLQFLDGGYPDSPPLGSAPDGKYCGGQTPEIPESSGRAVRVIFRSDSSVSSNTGFKLTYSEVRISCGGHIRLTDEVNSGEIESPNYPEHYPHNSDCVWVVTAPVGESIQFDFNDDFELELQKNCQYDYVEIRDGGTEHARQLGRFCGDDHPGTIKSTSNVAYARFRTDNSIPRKGFKATYQISRCGGTIRGAGGYISSPNFPTNYPANVVCEWRIIATTGHYLIFNFLNMDISETANCTGDFLQINDYNATGPVLGRVCGSSTSFAVGDTSDSYAYVRFVSDGSGTGTGFKLQFTSSIDKCGGALSTSTGVITSPNYPGTYAHSRLCTWHITVPTDRRVTLNFEDFRLEEGPTCLFDYVAVYNGISDNSPVIKRLCGDTVPAIIESSGSEMGVVFRTDGSVTNGGFKATWTSNNPRACGGALLRSTNATGIITSPGYNQNKNYSSALQCIWVLNNDLQTGGSIVVEFLSMDIEPNWKCSYDVLEVNEAHIHHAGSTREISRLCENGTLPKPVVSPAAFIQLIFITDSSDNRKGFKLKYGFRNCGGVITDGSGVITSPNYPRNYGHHLLCAWELVAPEGHQINITLVDLAMERHDKCTYDYVEVFNGGAASSPSIVKLCHITPDKKSLLSQSNLLRIVLKTDGSGNDRGFKLSYQFTNIACGGILHSTNGMISKPPAGSHTSRDCIWDLTVPPGYRINASFTENNLQCSRNEYVDLYLTNRPHPFFDPTARSERYCETADKHVDVTRPIITDSPHLRVRYRAARASQNTFSMNWTVVCGGVFFAKLDKVNQPLMSPRYPGNYDDNLNCTYEIHADPELFILLTFDPVFDIEPDTNPANGTTDAAQIACRYDHVIVYEKNETSGEKFGPYCGSTAPGPLSSQGTMIVQFNSDKSVNGLGFKATYSLAECGGYFNDTTDVISTPTYPSKYHHNANCTWNIVVKPNRIVALKFTVFELEGHSSCRFDSVTLYDGSTTADPVLGTFCGAETPPIVSSTGNAMLVTFKTDSSVRKDGFKAVYITTFGPKQGCGGILQQNSGNISSVKPEDSHHYASNLNCTWVIMADEGKVIRLDIGAIAMEEGDSGRCRFDFLDVRDGPSRYSPSFGRFCGRQTVPSLISSSNRLYVHFHTDGSVQKDGFVANYSVVNSACGGFLNATNDTQFLTSPGYDPSRTLTNNMNRPNQRSPVKCRWILDAPTGHHVRVNLTDSRLIPCSDKQTLEIRDEPPSRVSRVLTFCENRQTNRIFDSMGTSLVVDLVIDGSQRNVGFKLSYTIATCNRVYQGTDGQIFSPGWPGKYTKSADCTFYIEAPPGSKVSLYFNTFDLESHRNCRYDYLQINKVRVVNGENATLAQYCGRLLPDPIFSNTNKLMMKFKTDRSVTFGGYDITWLATVPGLDCGGNLTSSNGSLTSPGYPGNVTRAAECTWFIRPPPRQRYYTTLKLDFTDFGLGEKTNPCEGTYLRITRVHQGNQGSQLVGKFCGSQEDAPVAVTSDESLSLYYVTDGAGENTGFRATFKLVPRT